VRRVATLALCLSLAAPAAADASTPPPPPPQFFPLSAAPPLSAPPSGARGRIVRGAARQIGYHDHGPDCQKFGPCEEWCALFATWAWQHAGIPIPRYAFTGSVYYWAALHTAIRKPTATPKPGDAVLFGRGPRTVRTSVHMGIVERVYPRYLVTLEGNATHKVIRLVIPRKQAWRAGEPGPIYAYASPLRSGAARSRAAAASAARRLRAATRAGAAKLTPTDRRLARSLRNLRAFQHMPFHLGPLRIGWTQVNQLGQVQVAVVYQGPLLQAREAWAAFLAHWHDPGLAYAVSFYSEP
jgi:hypothetical protein